MKILIADDHAILREGIKTLVKTLPGVTSIEEASDGQQVYMNVKSTGFDLLILDIAMPQLSGLDVLQKLNDNGYKCKTLILSLYPEEHYAKRAFRLGANGYISKNAPFYELKKAIQKVAFGGRYVPANLAEKLAFNGNNKIDTHETLSNREFQVMLLLAKGEAISEIAEKKCLSAKTVSTYRSRIMTKMNMENNAELTMYAMNHQIIT